MVVEILEALKAAQRVNLNVERWSRDKYRRINIENHCRMPMNLLGNLLL